MGTAGKRSCGEAALISTSGRKALGGEHLGCRGMNVEGWFDCFLHLMSVSGFHPSKSKALAMDQKRIWILF